MGRSNPGTPFDEDGWADVLNDIAKLQLDVSGGSNDMNQASNGVSQEVTEYGFPLLVNNLSEFVNNQVAISEIKKNLQITPGLCHVTRTANYTYVSSADTIIFDKVVDDTTNSYNTATGVFTAPVSGIYTFNISVKNDLPASAANVRWNPQSFWELVMNGTLVILNEFETDVTYSGAATVSDFVSVLPLSMSLRLAQGDEITMDGSCLELISSNWGVMDRRSFFTATWTAQ